MFPKPGDLVRLIYKGASETDTWVDVNEQFYLMEISRRREASGDRSASLSLSTTADRRTSDQDIMVDVVRDIKVMKLHIQPYPFRYSYQSEDWLSAEVFANFVAGAPKYATFKILIDNTMTDVTKVLFKFETERLASMTNLSLIFASSTWFYYFFPGWSDTYPSDLRMDINGVDVTEQFGGPWATGGLNQSVSVEADITEVLRGDPGGLNQEHVVEVYSLEYKYSDLRVPGAPSLNTFGPNMGIVTALVTVQGTSQAIVSV
jgi:hypothetical protein